MVLHPRADSQDREQARRPTPETTDRSRVLIVRVVHSSVSFDWKLSRSDGPKVHPPIPKSRAFVRVGRTPLSAAFDLDSPAAAPDELAEPELPMSRLPKMESPEMKRELKPAPAVAYRTSRKSGVALYFQTRILDSAPA